MPRLPCTCSFAGTAKEHMVDELLALGLSFAKVEAATRAKGAVVKAERVSLHFSNCLVGQRPSEVSIQTAALTPLTPPPKVVAPKPTTPAQREADLARLVQQKAVEGIESGRLTVTVKDGLVATNLLDKREARIEERRFMLGLARLLSGAGTAGPQGDDPTVIDVTPRNPLLAPQSLRADD